MNQVRWTNRKGNARKGMGQGPYKGNSSESKLFDRLPSKCTKCTKCLIHTIQRPLIILYKSKDKNQPITMARNKSKSLTAHRLETTRRIGIKWRKNILYCIRATLSVVYAALGLKVRWNIDLWGGGGLHSIVCHWILINDKNTAINAAERGAYE